MYSLWVAFAVALAGALALTPLARTVARRLKVMDQPDGKRKLQRQPVPLFGGVAVYLALVLGLAAAKYFTGMDRPEFHELTRVVVAAAGFVCLFGCVDDTWNLSPRFKLLLQVCSVLPIVLGGFSIERVLTFGLPWDLGWLGVPLTVLWLVGCINALNLLDGMDGLASLVGLFTAAMLAIIAANLGHLHVSIIAIALAGALAGFLLFNLPPASVYLGDSGSMVIGLVVGILGMQAALKTPATLSITAPALLMCIPMLDTLLAIVRRKLTGQRFDTADRGHIHHRLLDRGLSNWQALGVIGLLCLMTGGAAAASIFLPSDGLACAVAISLVALLVRLRIFGHHELALLKLRVRTALVRIVQRLVTRLTAPSPQVYDSQEQIEFDAAWRALVEEARPWSATSLELTSDCGQGFARHTWQQSIVPAAAASQWSLIATFRTSDEQFCEVRLAGSAAVLGDGSPQAHLSQALTTFCCYWSLHAQRVPASLNWTQTPEGQLVGSPPKDDTRGAAQVA